nr:hypothetical protein HmN_000525000 [Hymenolepis microstoma]
MKRKQHPVLISDRFAETRKVVKLRKNEDVRVNSIVLAKLLSRHANRKPQTMRKGKDRSYGEGEGPITEKLFLQWEEKQIESTSII